MSNMGTGSGILKDGKCLCSKANESLGRQKKESVEYFFTGPR